MIGCPVSKKCFVPCLLGEELQHLHVHMLNIIVDAPSPNQFFHILHIPLYCHEFLDLLDRCVYIEYPISSSIRTTMFSLKEVLHGIWWKKELRKLRS
jgi:hypothetical protein